MRETDYPMETVRADVPFRQGEIEKLIDMLHGEIMKNRELTSMLDDRLSLIITSSGVDKERQDSLAASTPLGSRLNDMYESLRGTNSMLASLRERVEL